MRFTTLGCQPNTKLHGTENTSLLLMKTENVRWIVKGSCILVDVCVNSLSIRQRGCRWMHRDFWRDQCTIACFDVFPFVDHGLFSTPVQQYLYNFQKKCDVWCVGKQRVPKFNAEWQIKTFGVVRGPHSWQKQNKTMFWRQVARSENTHFTQCQSRIQV